MSSRQYLIHFAHRGEAQTFLKELHFKRLSELPFEIYQNPKGDLLLVSGEGMENALAAVSFALAKFQIELVINIGIAGSLRSELAEKDKLYQIRQSIYHDSAPRFQSFELAEGKELMDCVTSHDRVLDKERAKQLSHFAPIVDRELWGVAKACQLQQVELQCYKLISDLPIEGEKSDCLNILSKADQYSDRLYRYFEQLPLLVGKMQRAQIDHPVLKNQSFFFSQSMSWKLAALLKSLHEIEALSEWEDRIDQIQKSEKRPKERAKELIAFGERLVDPYLHQAEVNLKHKFRPVISAGWKIKTLDQFESSALTLKADIKTFQEFQRLNRSFSLLATHFEDEDQENV